MILKHFFLVFCFIPLFLFAQQPMKWGKIPKGDLEMRVYEPDTSAGAVILADVGSIELDFTTGKNRIVFTHHRRIKILKPSGFKWADVRLPYRTKNNTDKLYAYKAQTITPSGEKIALKRDNFYFEQLNSDWGCKKFTFPQVEEGAILEYTYKLESSDFFTLPEWFFQEEIPIRYNHLKLVIPQFMKYIFLYQGSVSVDKTTDYYMGNLYFIKVLQTAPELRLAVSGSTYPLRVNETIFTARDVPAFKAEPYMTSMDDYIAKINFQWQAIEDPTDLRTTPVMQTWEELADELYGSFSFGLQFAKSFWPFEMATKLNPLLKQATTTVDSVLTVYSHLQDAVSVDRATGIFCSKDLETLYAKGKADAGELNLMMIGALRKLGIPAWPVLISTRSHGKTYEQYPFIDQFNHVIVLAKIKGEFTFMDLGARAYPLNYLPVQDLNYRGMLLTRSNPRWIDLPAPKSESIYLGDFTLDEEGVLHGVLTCHFKGYEAFRQMGISQEAEDLRQLWEERLSKNISAAEVDSVLVEEWEPFSDHLSVKISCSFPEALTEAGDLSYLSMVGLSKFKENPFEDEERLYPISFPYPFKEKVVLNVSLSEGAAIESLPESVSLKLANKAGKLKYIVNQSEKGVQWISIFEVKQALFSKEEYPALRNLFSIYAEKWQELAALKLP